MGVVGPAASVSEPVERLRVILCDDDALVRRLLRDALQRAGIVVVAEAPDGAEALRLIRHYRPEVVLMDVAMPGMDGIETTRRITAEVPGVRVVLLTADPDDDLALSGLRAGAVGHLLKDDPPEAIAEALQRVHAGEAAVSGRLCMALVERLRMVPEAGVGLRPVRSRLTSREWEMLDLLCGGASTVEIAEALVLSTETVRSHVKNLLHKLGVRTREEAVALSATLRVPSPPLVPDARPPRA